MADAGEAHLKGSPATHTSGQVERHGNKLADLAHGLPSGTKLDL
jgi:hypothetical protein